MRVSVIQSNYIPWKGYFDIIANSDVMVFYDDVQFTKNDWRNRNQIRTSQGLTWLTVPVGTNINRLVNEVEIPEHSWQAKHWKTIMVNYKKAAHFESIAPTIEAFYMDKKWTNLSEMNQYFIEKVSKDFLQINTRFEKVENYSIKGDKQERLIDLLTQIGATEYLTGPTALSYINKNLFERNGIKVLVKEYNKYPPYQQRYEGYEGAVSIIDLLMCCGPNSREYAITENSFYEL